MDDCLYGEVSCVSQGESQYRNYKKEEKKGEKRKKETKNTLEQNV